MGLSSSQARLLNLTARMHQIEYKAARLEAMKLQMANESTRVYEEYLDALDKTKIQVKNLNADGSVTYKDLSNYDELLDAGYALNWHGTTFNIKSGDYSTIGNLYNKNGVYYGIDDMPKNADGSVNDTGYTKEYANWDNLVGEILDISVTDFETCITNLINSGDVTLVSKDKNGNFKQGSASDFDLYETSVATNTGLQEVADEVNLKKAEAKYEADMKRIDQKDRKYDTDLAALDTERNAIKQEMDTLKTVAKDNVERTFKLFS